TAASTCAALVSLSFLPLLLRRPSSTLFPYTTLFRSFAKTLPDPLDFHSLIRPSMRVALHLMRRDFEQLRQQLFFHRFPDLNKYTESYNPSSSQSLRLYLQFARQLHLILVRRLYEPVRLYQTDRKPTLY